MCYLSMGMHNGFENNNLNIKVKFNMLKNIDNFNFVVIFQLKLYSLLLFYVIDWFWGSFQMNTVL